ncbi:putative telomerase reverse transcriptase [Lyophyllum shimeji]|uniref:Telomerase reverse transcriptase n=1 Tax=Lyophyllum shimeji TaxID=47721 RepID=A0A9P3PRF2_LYOSH|nr:putative telomerase reverse transcriptase [Lyophyllum shimeji]
MAMTDMREVIDRAQERIFRSKNAQNIITAGYRRASKEGDRGKTSMTRVGITNHFVNTIVTALQSPEWDVLLQRIGVDAMLHLLCETSIFVSLPNGCLCQMTGEPIIYAVPKFKQVLEPAQIAPSNPLHAGQKRHTPFDHDLPQQRATKRRKLNPSASTIQSSGSKEITKNRSPVEVALSRARLFYSRPKLVPHTNQIIVGLPEKHILNQIRPSYQRPPKIEPGLYVDPDPREQERHTRHLSKYVFPRQYGLASPFTETDLKRHVFGLPDYTDREFEIKVPAFDIYNPIKLTKTGQGILQDPRKAQGSPSPARKNDMEAWKMRLQALARQSLPFENGKRLDSSVILECISEQSILLSQAPLGAGNTSVDSHGNSILPPGLTQAERDVKSKPRFADFACPPIEVFRYVALVTKTVIPKAFWGNEANFKVILRYVKEFIQCRRFESLTLHHIIQGFSTLACDWLMPPGEAAHRQSRVSVSDALKRRELLEEFIFWYFDSFVSSLLKTNFYITETSAFRNRVLYFRHDDWAAMCAPLIERLASGTFLKMTDSEAKEVLRQRRLGYSFVRLLPKETGVRPIVNLRRRKPIQGRFQLAEQSINQILQAAFHILSYEKREQPHRLGASVFSPDDVYSKLKDFKSRIVRPDGKLPRLYFVKVDVQACFDTIEQSRLLEILRELISEDLYMMQRYGQMRMVTGRIKRTFVKKAVPEDDHPHFLTYAAQLAGVLRNTVFVDQVVYPYSQRKEILSLLEEHITENIVKIGPHFYRQTVGIPQGSILSALLCSFFYGDLEKRFTDSRNDLESVLLRLIDDYLFITTSRARAVQFVQMMEKGHPEYGCFIAKEKTLTNFDYGIQVSNVTEPKQQSFPWCGYMINMQDLSVSVDYSRYRGTSLRDTLTIDRGRHPGASFTQKMLWLAKTKCHPIYCDPALNPDNVVYLNIYRNFLLCAMKMHGYLCEWGIKFNKNSAFINNTIQTMIGVSYSTLRSKIARKTQSGANVRQSGIQKLAVKWLGTHAFYVVLSKKPARHASLLRSLSFELSRPRSKRYKQQFSSVIKDGLAGLADISF